MDDNEISFDVVIVGAGAAGLSAAIRLMQQARDVNLDITVCVLEKGAAVGSHIISGAVLEPRALNELLPDWQSMNAPLRNPVTEDEFYFLTRDKSLRLPTPPQMRNSGRDNHIISLGEFCIWLAGVAEGLGVQIFPGFAAVEVLYDDKGRAIGVKTGDMGVAKTGERKQSFQPGMVIKSKYLLISEGCRGSLAGDVMEKFSLRKNVSPQTYALGIKEVWEVNQDRHKPGYCAHSIGWPLGSVYGGSFIYHWGEGKVSIGLVSGLDYSNPYLNPYEEFQRFKSHPWVKSLLEGGRRISYGARALNEGGWQAIPKLDFPGGAIIGCSAGFLNVPKIKGIHTAMKSGMIAAEQVILALKHLQESEQLPELDVTNAVKSSWIGEELKRERNIRPAFARWGLWGGLAYAAVTTYLFRGREPWTFKHKADHTSLKPARMMKKINYPPHDRKLSFSITESLYLSGTNHEEDQPCHLILKNPAMAVDYNLAEFDAPEQRYCPAGVYEIRHEGGVPRLQINAQNCLHCKTCDIKDPTNNIKWIPPEGSGGPAYVNM